MHDLNIRNARIIDGTGNDAFMGDIAVDQGRIAAIATPGRGPAGLKTIDADGRVVCPGFIDMHSHSDWSLSAHPRAESKIHQGVTTELVGNCGSSLGPVVPGHFEDFKTFVNSHGGIFNLPAAEADWPWPDLAAFYQNLAGGGMALNIAPLVGHGALRCAVMGFDRQAPNPVQLARMAQLLQREIDQGLFGLSAGLIYHPGAFAAPEELGALARVVRGAGGLFTLHMRSESHGVLDAIQEGLEISARSGVALEISHLKSELPVNWGRSVEMLALLDRARARGLPVDFDLYPYTAYCCGLLEIFPPWVKDQGPQAAIRVLADTDLRRRVEREMTRPPFDWENPMEGLGWDQILLAGFTTERYRTFDGHHVAAIADALELSPTEAIFQLFAAEQGGLTMIVFSMCEDDLERIMRHPAAMIGSDGFSLAADSAAAGVMVHPRSYGTYPRVLGRYVRQRKTLSLETAIAKMSGLPAKKLGLTDRGLLREGLAADLVVFDPDTVIDKATFEEPHRYPAGIHYVVVNGQVVVQAGEHTGLLPGGVLKRPGKETGEVSTRAKD